ncbi:MAG TPA: 6-carboxytetrahydropterin synthase [Thermoplasmataceae archaeon]|nr:6-carboxytetrahydropterin synthase [Thermoplasmatales archaeon AK]HLH86475.1 6-carboxytetrahydropterin synthase [Thermoplasmataceae archaeon]
MKIHIDGYQNHLNFSAAHFIPSIEKCSRLHGHDYAVSVDIEGDPVDGIIVDYGVVKGEVRRIIEPMDHRVLIPRDGGQSHSITSGQEVSVKFNGKSYVFPVSDVYFLDSEVSSSEALSQIIAGMLRDSLNVAGNVRTITVTIFEGPGNSTSFSESLNAR